MLKADLQELSVYDGKVLVTLPGEAPPGQSKSSEVRHRVASSRVLSMRSGWAPIWADLDPDDDWRDGWKRRTEASSLRQVAVQQTVRGPVHRTIRDINPEVYLSVEVEMNGAEDRSEQKAAQVQIQKIKIRSENWDRLRPDRKVKLLNETFYLLKGRYPGIDHSVVLEFDDGRPNLRLLYPALLQG